MRSSPVRILIPLQMAAATMALVVLTLSPPASGRILVVPLPGHDAGDVAQVALAGGALFLETGPIAGSLVVLGERASLARHIAYRNVLLLAAPPAGCGDPPASAT